MSENLEFFKDTVDRILADTLEYDAFLHTELNDALPEKLIAALSENGIFLALVPEELGGVGTDLADGAAIARALGDAAAPGPLVETLAANAVLGAAGLAPAEGLATLVFGSGGQAVPAELHDVPWGGVVGTVVIVTTDGENARVVRTRGADWTATPGKDPAGERRDRLSGHSGETETGTILDGRLPLRTASLLRAAQQLGAIEWAFRRSVEYAGERKQFGREISKFQAVQQMLAELAGHVLASAGIVEAAADNPVETLVAAARSRLGDAADSAITITHQVHGALGFSREYALNARTRRLMAWRDDFGSVPAWRMALAAKYTGLSRDGFWPAISDAANAA